MTFQVFMYRYLVVVDTCLLHGDLRLVTCLVEILGKSIVFK